MTRLIMNEDVHWLAFQYIADELSDAGRTAFEDRLSDDQEAREAVAQAVELAAAVRLAEPADLVTRRESHRKISWATWAVGVASASLAILAFLHAFPVSQPDPRAEKTEIDAVQLAHAWSEVREIANGDLFGDEVLSEAIVAARELTDVESLAVPAPAELNADPPSWMVVALSDFAQENE